MIPIQNLHAAGLEYGVDYVEKRYDIGIGLHGDHVGGELDAVKALAAGEVDAAWCLDLNYEAWVKDGTLDEAQIALVYRTPAFDHCIFSACLGLEPERFAEFDRILNKMDYANPAHQEMMDLEGLKAWVPGRISGFEQITKANEYLNFFQEFHAE